MIWSGNINTREEPLVTTIKTVAVTGGIPTDTVELNDPPARLTKDMCFAWGTDDTDAIQHAIDVAKETGVAIYIPPGHFVVTETLEYVTDFVIKRRRSFIHSK